ncbi:alanine racemase [Pseudoclavibacter chungangensis]|uniref:alanine racemase n=1 Tax=Pseudoclavibacter chungangensis TaxID=587635 RepID=UPI0017B2B45A|nr:alanine racemase [Pseudoclavibacter chungangensis]NYJ65539.1 alanine racemase [Pseudoclavibacter chungangensis]
MSYPRIEVDLDAFRHNVRTLREAMGGPVLAVVKANAYGHGAVEVARAALEAGADMLGVVDLAEALALREAGIEAPVLAWMLGADTTWQEAFDAEIELGVSSLVQLDALAHDALAWRAHRALDGGPAPVALVHLKVDTGLGRGGAVEADWGAYFARAAELERDGLIRVRGLLSHLSGASPDDDRAQVAVFERAHAAALATGLDPAVRHLSATAGGLRIPEARFDLVRLGVAMYGLSPFGGGDPAGVELRPALRLLAPVVRVASDDGTRGWAVEVGAAHGLPPVGEGDLELADADGGRWRVVRVETVRTIVEPIVPPPSIEVLADRVGAAGDEGRADDAVVRDLVVIGDPGRGEPGADAWAAAASTINYEIVARLHADLPRSYAARRADTAARHAQAPAPRTLAGGRGTAPRTAPARSLEVDVTAFERALDGSPVDVSADAYGLGVARILPALHAAGAVPVVRTSADVDRVERETGIRPQLDPSAPDATRDAYGFDDASGRSPVVSLRSELVLVKHVEAGQGVSYGYTWVAAAPTVLGLVPVGYADGLVRRVGGRAWMLVDGVRRPIVGRVAMDQVVVDLGDSEPAPGAPVVIFGDDPGAPSLRDWAEWSGVRPEALTASLGPRIRRGDRSVRP